MWHIREIKKRANHYMQTSYWRSVVTALAAGLTTSCLAGVIIELGLAITAGMAQLDFGELYYGINMTGLPVSPTLLSAICSVILIGGVAVTVIGICIEFFLMKPIETGCRRYYIVNHAMPGRARCAELFHAFGNHYLNVVWTMLLKSVYTFLWSVLLVIPGWLVLTFVLDKRYPVLCLLPLAFPGLIKHYAYRLVPYILAEEPGMDAEDAFHLSRRMMRGNKWRAFRLDLSFLGWQLLNCCTLGILGILYVGPYRHTASAEMYITVRDQYLHQT